MEQLKDIKPIIVVPDVSLYYFLALLFVGLIVLIVLAMGVVRWIKKRQPNKARQAREVLEKLTYEDAKASAYSITKWAGYLADTEEQQALHVELIQRMATYKYKRDVPAFCEEDQQCVKAYLEACRG